MPFQQSRGKERTVEEPEITPERIRRITGKDDKYLKDNKYLIPWPRDFAERTHRGPELHGLVKYMEANICAHVPILAHTTKVLNYKIAGATTTPISIHVVYLNDFPWNQLVCVCFSVITQCFRGNKIPRRPTRTSLVKTLGNLNTIEGIADEIQKAAEWDRTIRRLIQNEITNAVVATASTPGAWLLNYTYSAILDMMSAETGRDIEVRSIPKQSLAAFANATLPVVRSNLQRQARQHGVPGVQLQPRTHDVSGDGNHTVCTMQLLAWLLLERRSVHLVMAIAWHAGERALTEVKPAQ